MKRLLAIILMSAPLTACLDFERMTMRFDLKSLSGELEYINLVSDNPESVEQDFQELLRYVNEPVLKQENPGWGNINKELYEVDGQLNGRVTYEVISLADAGIYKHDRRSPYIYCADSVVLRTNGRDISHTLDGCVAWDRKTKVLELELGDGVAAESTSLLGHWTNHQNPKSSGSPDGMPRGGAPAR